MVKIVCKELIDLWRSIYFLTTHVPERPPKALAIDRSIKTFAVLVRFWRDNRPSLYVAAIEPTYFLNKALKKGTPTPGHSMTQAQEHMNAKFQNFNQNQTNHIEDPGKTTKTTSAQV